MKARMLTAADIVSEPVTCVVGEHNWKIGWLIHFPNGDCLRFEIDWFNESIDAPFESIYQCVDCKKVIPR